MVPLPLSGSGEGVYRQRCCSTSPPPAASGSCKSHHVTSHFSKAWDVTQHDEDAAWCILLQQVRKNICHQYFCFSSICTWLLFPQVPVLFFFHILRRPAVNLLSYTDCHGQSVCPTDAGKSREISTKWEHFFQKRKHMLLGLPRYSTYRVSWSFLFYKGTAGKAQLLVH